MRRSMYFFLLTVLLVCFVTPCAQGLLLTQEDSWRVLQVGWGNAGSPKDLNLDEEECKVSALTLSF